MRVSAEPGEGRRFGVREGVECLWRIPIVLARVSSARIIPQLLGVLSFLFDNFNFLTRLQKPKRIIWKTRVNQA